jgi:hypothetical protein
MLAMLNLLSHSKLSLLAIHSQEGVGLEAGTMRQISARTTLSRGQKHSLPPTLADGDVPGKVKQISYAACQFNFQWSQNTRSAHFLSTHAGACRMVNEDMITEMGADLNVLVVQA